MKSAKRFWVPAVAAVLALAAGVVALRRAAEDADAAAGREQAAPAKRTLRVRPKTASRDPKAAVQEVVSKRRIPRARMGEKPGFEAFLDELSAADKTRVLSVQEALDEDDFAAVARAAHGALASANPEVREAAIEALGWFGAEALPELTPLMADPNDDVAEAAISQWELALGEIDAAETRAAIAEAVMQTLTRKDALESIVCEITNQDDDLAILESLVAIIEGENAVGAEVARDAYETLTGEAWTDIDAANRWLEENYDPPEADDAEDE